MKIIDAHNHPDWWNYDLRRYLTNMDEYGISQAWLFSWECGVEEYGKGYAHVIPALTLGTTKGPIPFCRCLSYKERCPDRFILGYCPDPRERYACEQLKEAHDTYGAQVCGELKCRMMYDSPDALRLFRLAGELGMPVTFHMDYDRRTNWQDPWCEWFGGTIDTVERFVKACPQTNFLGHAPGFWIHISGDDLWQSQAYPPANAKVLPGGRVPELLRKYPNLYCDLSAGSARLALARDPEFAVRFLTEFQDRVCYARDFFDNELQKFLATLNLPAEILEKIYHGNAEKLVGN